MERHCHRCGWTGPESATWNNFTWQNGCPECSKYGRYIPTIPAGGLVLGPQSESSPVEQKINDEWGVFGE